MAKARTAKTKAAPAERESAPRELAVGRPLQARLIALELQLGLFSAEPRFGSGSRFHHPVVVPTEAPVPEGMAKVFATDFAALRRLGRATDACHSLALGPYRASCVSYFHYDGFRALVYVERDGKLVAAWREEEVLQPHSPRTLLAGVDDAGLEAFLEHVPAA